MKIVLDLEHSFSNYEWESKEELKEFIEDFMIPTLWCLYTRNEQELGTDKSFLDDEEYNKLYDILDMFRSFEIIEKIGEHNGTKETSSN